MKKDTLKGNLGNKIVYSASLLLQSTQTILHHIADVATA